MRPVEMIRSDAMGEREARRELNRGRSVIDMSLPFKDRILDEFFLFEKGDRETVQLLMRGASPRRRARPPRDPRLPALTRRELSSDGPSESFAIGRDSFETLARARVVAFGVASHALWS